MRLKIFAAHHARPIYRACHDIFMPIWGGGTESLDGDYIIDSLIPRRATLGLNETALQYYVAKHLADDLDYVGFEHYRRIFLFPSIFNDQPELEVPQAGDNWHSTCGMSKFSALINARESAAAERIRKLRQFIGEYDIVLPLPKLGETMRYQWVDCGQDPHYLDVLERCIFASDFYKHSPFSVDFDRSEAYYCNMFVMRTELFKTYVRLWQEVMFALEGAVDFSSRMPSFLSERLFSLYFTSVIQSEKLKVATVPFCFCIDWKVANEVK